jgi:molybdenum cofactor synthesis domain-containing protein
MRWKIGLLMACGKGFRGEREDTSAQVIRELVEEELQGEIVEYRVVPEEKDELMAALIEMTDYYKADLILTAGGIGMGPGDITPEATLAVVDRLAPGFAEAMRAEQMKRSPLAMLTRAVSGIRGRTLILNLPADPKGVHECLEAVMYQLPVALAMLRGNVGSGASVPE